MSLGTTNRDGGKTSESGHLRSVYKYMAGEVLGGLAVSQRGAGANMSVDIAVGDAILPRSDATYGHPSFNDAVLNKTVTAADPSNPRRDIVMMYLDYTVTPSTGVSNNTNGVVATKVVAGTPAGSPADPSDAALQSAAGSGNPYIKLARIRVGAGVTTIGNSVIDDLRSVARAVDNGGWKNQAPAWDTWAYSAWDSTNKLGTITVPDTTIFTLGQKVRFWQLTGGWKYGFIVKLASSTSLIVYMGNNYILNNERVYLPAVSREKAPDGFDINPDSWTVKVTNSSDCNKGSPTLGANWYGGALLSPTGPSIAVPIGLWDLGYSAAGEGSGTTGYQSVKGTLSTANNTESDPELSSFYQSGPNLGLLRSAMFKRKRVALTANTTYFLNVSTANSPTTVGLTGAGGQPTLITAICAYL